MFRAYTQARSAEGLELLDAGALVIIILLVLVFHGTRSRCLYKEWKTCGVPLARQFGFRWRLYLTKTLLTFVISNLQETLSSTVTVPIV